MQKSEKRTLIKYAVITIAVSVIAVFIVFNVEQAGYDATPQQQTLAIIDNGIDAGKSLYTEEEKQAKLQEIKEKADSLRSASSITVEEVVAFGQMAQDLHDYDAALKLYSLADTMNPKDLFYQVEKGRIYLELQQWEQARQVFEILRINFPVHEAYLGLAQAYRHIDGTPQYIIDDIYRESLVQNMNRSEVLIDFIDWLEQTGREKETLQYYEILNNQAPQQVLEDKIKELKQKYPDA